MRSRGSRRRFFASASPAGTAIPSGRRSVRFSKNLDRSFAQTNRLRREGTDALLGVARDAGVRRFVAQSFANFRYARVGEPVKTEDDPLDPLR